MKDKDLNNYTADLGATSSLNCIVLGMQDFTTGIDRAHMGVDNLSNYNPKLDTIIYTEENGTRLHDTIPKSDLPGYREKVVNGAILLVPNK